ncbi:esterase-like activity of phytase family protein [Ideonella sp.]|uniref:esterase-like activity of phytase family protein n=1 Tax=Ideonella sp. TaxID=1929293 RepID=UPI002B48FD67|nr:esterase-like activity of phytase family protein [Ideonella sp.]HJV70733.1 esterase-like activity of phytase family protein [Ideonella sp.]
MTLAFRPARLARLPLAAALACTMAAGAHAAGTLTGFAMMPADTFAPGPTSGQFASGANGRTLPLVDRQPVQGFSAVLPGPRAGTFRVMPDNGFGTKANSPDALLRLYSVRPDFRRFDGSGLAGSGTVVPVDRDSGQDLAGFDTHSFVTLHDPEHRIGFPLVADGEFYPYAGSGPGSADIPVDKAIRKKRLLTGADFDIESVRMDRKGRLWFGEEFGPFLLQANAHGKVLRTEVPMPGVTSPDNPHLNGGTANLGRSKGFEGMAIDGAGKTLFTLLEGTVTGDPAGSLRINAFDIASAAYTGAQWLYRLDPQGTNIGDMTAVNDHQFLVIERNGTETPRFKKIFLIDLNAVDGDGFVSKAEVVDLMNVADPHDLNQDGQGVFTFPFVTIEDVLVLDAKTLLVINDNNYPGSSRDSGVPDPTEFLRIELDTALPLDPPNVAEDES